MPILNSLSKFEIPNIEEIIKSVSNAKNKMSNLNINKVSVHFLFSDGRFKQTVDGTMFHISEIPIVLIDAPSKLGFLVFDDCLIYDVTNERFEIFVDETHTHAISLTVTNDIDIDEKLSNLINDNEFITPISISQLKRYNINISDKDDETKEIKLLPSFLSSLGRAKLLENTTEKNNDGLIITLFIGLLMGVIIGGIGTTIFII